MRDHTLWKYILEEIFEDFLRFFYPNADEIFDFTRGFVFLDKELEDLFPANEANNVRYVDKLVKVWLKNGNEEWILIHIEVQGDYQKIFSERMFRYFYLIFNKHNVKITAWAIFTDTNKKFKPASFETSFLGTGVKYWFNTYKIFDQKDAELKNSDNPFAIVVLTVLLALKKEKVNEVKLIDLKIEIAKNLLKRNFPKEKIKKIFHFLKFYVRFNDENSLIFDKKFDHLLEKSESMGLEEYILERERKQYMAKGIEQGIVLNPNEVIRNLRVEEKFSIEKIAKIVRLSTVRVREILEEMEIV